MFRISNKQERGLRQSVAAGDRDGFYDRDRASSRLQTPVLNKCNRFPGMEVNSLSASLSLPPSPPLSPSSLSLSHSLPPPSPSLSPPLSLLRSPSLSPSLFPSFNLSRSPPLSPFPYPHSLVFLLMKITVIPGITLKNKIKKMSKIYLFVPTYFM